MFIILKKKMDLKTTKAKTKGFRTDLTEDFILKPFTVFTLLSWSVPKEDFIVHEWLFQNLDIKLFLVMFYMNFYISHLKVFGRNKNIKTHLRLSQHWKSTELKINADLMWLA